MKYGKLTLLELKAFLAQADTVDAAFAELRGLAALKHAQVAKGLFAWGAYYEMPPQQYIALVLRQFGIDGLFVNAALSPNPMEALSRLADMEIPDEWVDTPEKKAAVLDKLALAVTLFFSMRAVAHFGKWMPELLRAGDDESLLNAVSIDPVASGSQVFQERLANAALFGDTVFLNRYAKALGGPSKKISRQHNRIRVAAKVLMDAGAFPMPEKQLVELFCDELKLYSPGADPGKALKKVIKVVTPTPTT